MELFLHFYVTFMSPKGIYVYWHKIMSIAESPLPVILLEIVKSKLHRFRRERSYE